MRVAWAAVAMTVATVPAMAQDVDEGGSEIVVTGRKPLRIDGKILRAALERFARDRTTLSPQGVLRFEFWRGTSRVRADGMQLALTNAAGDRLPVRVDGDGRVVLDAVPKGRWFLTAPARPHSMALRPMILSAGTKVEDRRLGDLRMQCRVAVAMARVQASELSMPLIKKFDAKGGCGSRDFQFYHRAEQRLASAVAIGPGPDDVRPLPLSSRRTSYSPPLSDRKLDHETRVRTTYQ